MEKVRAITSEMENLIALLLAQKEKLKEMKEVDSSNGSISKTMLAITQLGKKLDTILGNKEPRASEELEMEVCENE